MFPVANKLIVKMFVVVRVFEHTMLPVIARSLTGTFDGSTMRCTIPPTRYEIFWDYTYTSMSVTPTPLPPKRIEVFGMVYEFGFEYTVFMGFGMYMSCPPPNVGP